MILALDENGKIIEAKRQPHQRPQQRGCTNATEARFSAYLDLLVKCGELRSRGEFESKTFQVGRCLKYTPDFTAVDKDGRRIAFEVKGTRRTKVRKIPAPYMTAAARLRLRFAAQQFPDWRFVVVFQVGNRWMEQEIVP